MGFFFNRKPDQANDTASSKENGVPDGIIPKSAAADSGSMVKSLRSRFQVYTRKLDKERDSPPPVFVQSASVAQTLSPPPATPIANRHLQLKLKLSSSSPALSAANRDQARDRSKSANTSPTIATNRHSAAPMPSHDPRPSSSRSRALGTKSSSSSLQLTPAVPARKPTDSVTATLAQRLNELAVANSEGLLNDDEYRLLRQDLFQRFASTTVVPTETPIVPLAAQHKSRTVRVSSVSSPDKRQSLDSKRLSISGSSNFAVDKQRTPSMHSRSSMTSGVASFFRRVSGRNASYDYSDSSSIFSATSAAPSEATGRFHRLTKKTSQSSLHGDSVSISSRRTTNVSSPTESQQVAGGSTRSIRRLPAPPSSFTARLPGTESRYAGAGASTSTGAGADDDARLQTAQTIRHEMLAVEAEGRRLMDAFSGLELSTLTQRRRTAASSARDSVATLIPDARSVHSVGRRVRKGYDAERDDGASIRSGMSAGTAPSMTSRRAMGPRPKAGGSVQVQAASFVSSASSSRVGSLHRKNSVSSVTSSTSRLGIGGNGGGGGAGGGSGGLVVPPVPPLPLGMSLGQMGSTPSLTRSTGHLPMGSVPEGEAVLTEDVDDEREFGLEMEDLRRRREEVHARYEARLEYLRAKLKGAELHEKLLSK
ncbi:hypothetical protein B0H10DRAFT_2020610 [Mycena sp. CBHHK59/15]|nr:hypothetical protein B0H10DRAFT_2020610 [Mycena sp. CBHHK59/15]